MEFDISTITTLIGSLGFPIVSCIYMMLSMNKAMQNNTKATENLSLLVQKMNDRLNMSLHLIEAESVAALAEKKENNHE